MMKKIILLITFIITAELFLYAFHLRINLSRSMPLGVYRENNVSSQSIKNGDLAEVCLPDKIARYGLKRHYISFGNCNNHSRSVIKKIIAIPNDNVSINSYGIFVNNKYLINSKPLKYDSNKRKIPRTYLNNYKLKKDEYLLLGTNSKKSWDSRYYGPINSRYIKAEMSAQFEFDQHFLS